MPYGIIKVDQVTFTNAGVDQTISVSGIVASISGNITATGTISGNVIRGGTTVSGATVTGTAGQFGTITGNTAGFTTVTGTTVTGITATFTSGVFTNISGGTHTITSGVFASGTAANPSITFQGDVNTGIYSPGAEQVAISTGGSGRLFIDANGGISTSSTAWQGGVAYQAGGLQIGGSVYAKAILQTNGTIRSEWFYDNADTYLQAKAGIFYITNTTANPIGFYTNGNERLRITSAGLVGIGTSSPLTKLDVRSGVITAGSNSSPNGTEILRGYYSDTDGALAIIGTEYSSGGIVIGSAVKPSTSSAGAFFSSTNINIARGAYTIAGNVHKWYIGSAQTVAENSSVSTSEVMRIDSSGRLGIGTTSPSNVYRTTINGDGSSIVGGLSLRNNGTETLTIGNVTAANDVDSEIWNPRNGYLRFATNNAERARIDSSGRLLVGTSTNNSTFNSRLQVKSDNTTANGVVLDHYAADTSGGIVFLAKSRSATVGTMTVVQNGDTLGEVEFWGADGTQHRQGAAIAAVVDGTPGAADLPSRLVFSTTADGASSPTERMRITSGGTVGIGITNPTSSFADGNGVQLLPIGVVYSNRTSNPSATFGRNTSTGDVVTFAYGSAATNPGQVGSVSVTASATAYNTSSDYRLKENVEPIIDGIARLQELKPSRFNFIVDPNRTVDGFIAHEVQEIVPEAITGEKDAVDDDGNPVYQGIDQSKLVPLLTAALQEAIGEIELLKARVAALEAA